EFCDANVLIYAHDVSAGEKHVRARRLLERLWDSGGGVVSVQVFQEFYVNITRKVLRPLSPLQARGVIAELIAWHVVAPVHSDLLAAIDRSLHWRVSFWDAMVLTTAIKAGASVLWSEELNHGQAYEGTVVRNPFRGDS
ncbi:MAG: PIN domain-containing protein, partial [Chloroflexi bacterium]|nr:PIN domain-containing protein [Chloroflexota bacterium]